MCDKCKVNLEIPTINQVRFHENNLKSFDPKI